MPAFDKTHGRQNNKDIDSRNALQLIRVYSRFPPNSPVGFLLNGELFGQSRRDLLSRCSVTFLLRMVESRISRSDRCLDYHELLARESPGRR
jgi:hypothetical protein